MSPRGAAVAVGVVFVGILATLCDQAEESRRLRRDNVELTSDMDALVARIAELADENAQLQARTALVPMVRFEPSKVVPFQRRAGGQS